MRVLLLSTYELGHQPLGIAGPAAALQAAGHETLGVDLAQTELPDEAVTWAESVAISIPMHTATRLALDVVARLRRHRPDLPVALHGLYAPVAGAAELFGPADLLVAGDPIPALLAWLAGDTEGASPTPAAVRVELGPARPGPSLRPARSGLPPLSSYARLALGDNLTVAASVAASHGCNHKCRHCPVASVYDGRSRAIAVESVLADIDQVVEMGAGHVSFADPDFLNRPRHALEVASGLHERHPGLTFDATVKIEHILKHARIWPELAAAGLIFLTSAFESTDDLVLEVLDKGHTASDEWEAVRLVRRAGIEIRPSWLPFTPWTTFESLAGLLEFSARTDLLASTDAVQYSIRLLLPMGSLLLAAPDETLRGCLDAAAVVPPERWALSAAWRALDPALDSLQQSIAARAEEGVTAGETHEETFHAIWALARAAGAPLAASPPTTELAWRPASERPRLTEAWFCCAEPTGAQLARVAAPA